MLITELELDLCVEIINSKRQVKRKLGHVVQIRVCPAFDVNVMPEPQRLLAFCPKFDA